MTDDTNSTPERLAAFRAEYQAPKASRTTVFVPIALALLLILTAINLFLALTRGTTSASGTSGDSATDQRALASYLVEKNLPGEASAAYRRYIDSGAVAGNDLANVCVSAADAAIQAERFEEALSFLYEADFKVPNSDRKPDIDKKIAFCLEKLNRSTELKHELRNRTTLSKTKAEVAPNETVLAEIGDAVITNRDLDAEINRMPEGARSTYDKPEKREELLKSVVARKVLVEKARRLELDKDEAIQTSLAEALEQLMVSKLIEQDVASNVKITPEDVQRYYQAEIKRFTRPAAVKVLIATGATEAEVSGEATYSTSPVTAIAGESIPGIANSETVAATLVALDKDATSAPTQLGDKWYRFKIVDKQLEEVQPFERVQASVQRLLEQQKRQEQMNALLSQTLQSDSVKLYPERLREAQVQ